MTSKITFTVGGEKHVLPTDSSKTLRVGSVSPSVAMEVEEVAMTDTEKKALALVNEVRDERGFRLNVEMQREDMAQEALCRAIEQHEAFRQEVSDAVEKHLRMTAVDCSSLWHGVARDNLSRFIIAKPDPLVDLCYSMGLKVTGHELRAAIEARGGRIVWEGE